MKRCLGIYLLFLSVHLFGATVIRSDRLYEYNGEVDGWLKFHMVPATWHEAVLRCGVEGAVLASPTSSQMLLAMRELIVTHYAPKGALFTGVHDILSKGEYISIDGVPLIDIPADWAPNQPDNLENSEDCLILDSEGKMTDVRCDSVYSYVCYRKAAVISEEDANARLTWRFYRNLNNRIASATDYESDDVELDEVEMITETASESTENLTEAEPNLEEPHTKLGEGEWAEDSDGSLLTPMESRLLAKGYIAHEPRRSYYKLNYPKTTWEDARDKCRKEGGDLAVINSEAEAKFLSENILEKGEEHVAFVGVKHINGGWFDVTGKSLLDTGYDKWVPGEPNNARRDEFCMTVKTFKGEPARLNDDPCDRLQPFVCEIEINPYNYYKV